MKKTILILMLASSIIGAHAQSAGYAVQPKSSTFFSLEFPLTVSLGIGAAKPKPITFDFRGLISLYDENKHFAFGPSYRDLTADEMKAVKNYCKFWYFKAEDGGNYYNIYAGWDKDMIMGMCSENNTNVPGFDMTYCQFNSFLDRTLGTVMQAFNAQIREAGVTTVSLVEYGTGLFGQYGFSVIPAGATKQKVTFSVPETKRVIYDIFFTHEGKEYHSFLGFTVRVESSVPFAVVEKECREQNNLPPEGELWISKITIEVPSG
ncbi:MAG: hypothetical protein LBN74_09205, partial [Prevotella sp.]|nr:hypothetical protein [Prevotella sp.]